MKFPGFIFFAADENPLVFSLSIDVMFWYPVETWHADWIQKDIIIPTFARRNIHIKFFVFMLIYSRGRLLSERRL